MSKDNITFLCPKCGCIIAEEIMVDICVSTEISAIADPQSDDPFILLYGEQTNEGGYVERYQCNSCGFLIADDKSPHADDGLDEYALVKAVKEMNVGREAEIQAVLDANQPKPKPEPEPLKKGDEVSFCEIIDRITEANESLTGKELAEVFNRVSEDQVIYEGDSIFWVKT